MSGHRSHDPRPRRASGAGGKYLTFALGGEEYGLPVLKVREIIKMMDITQVPQVPRSRQGRHQPARQGDSGGRSAAEVRLRRRRTTPSAPASSSSTSRCRRQGDDGRRRRCGVRGAERRGRRDRADAGVRRARRRPTTCSGWPRSRARSRSCSTSTACSAPTAAELRAASELDATDGVLAAASARPDRSRSAAIVAAGLREERHHPARRQAGAGRWRGCRSGCGRAGSVASGTT